MRILNKTMQGAVILFTSLLLGGNILEVSAQGQGQGIPQDVTMCMFHVNTAANGQQFVVTRSGVQLPIPGAGIQPGADSIAVYQDYQGNYWFNDRYGQPVKVPASQVAWKMQQLTGQVQAQGMPQGQYQQAPSQVTNNIYQQAPDQSSSSSGSSGSSALGTGLAAAGGAMAGSMLGGMINGSYYNNNDYYHGIPYGTAMYRDGNQAYYHNNSGNKVYVNNTKNNSATLNEFNKQGTWDNRQSWANNANKQNYDANKQNYQQTQNRQDLNQDRTNQQNRANMNQNRQANTNRFNGGGRFSGRGRR